MPSRKSGGTATRNRNASSRRQAVQTAGSVVSARRFGGRFRFIGDTLSELKKVTWLSKREVAYLTGLVLLVAVSVGTVLGLLDLGLSDLVSRFILGN